MQENTCNCAIPIPCCTCIQMSNPCSLCNICEQCNECNGCNECNELNKVNNSQNEVQADQNSKILQNQKQNDIQQQLSYSGNNCNNYKLQIYDKDKKIMNYTKQLEQQNRKLEALEQSLEVKDKKINGLENTIKELNTHIESQKKEIFNNNDLIDKYKYQIKTQVHTNEQNQNDYDNNYSNMTYKLEQNILKINELEQINSKLNSEINQLQKEIYSKNEIIENKNLMNERLSNENKNLPMINKKLIECENNIKILRDENLKLKKYNMDLLNENKKLNQKLKNLYAEINKKENNFNIETYNINNKLNKVAQEFQSSSQDFEKYRMEKDALFQEQEKFNNFVNVKLNEINEFLIRALNTPDINKLSEEFNNSKNNIGDKYYTGSNDIKFELVENSINEMKKNILKFAVNCKEKSDKFLHEYNNLSRDREMLESHNSEMVNELNSYRQNQNQIENKAKEMSLNYEKLRDSYTKLYNDFNKFTNSNTNYVNNMQGFLLELIEKINSTLGDKNNDNKEKTLNEILKECISRLINEYKILVKRLEENGKKDEITFKKILEMEKLLEESQKIGKEYEAENRRLKTELERLNYRYNLLKVSIDTVEYKIKSES